VSCASTNGLSLRRSPTTQQRAVRRVKMERTRSWRAPSRIQNSAKVGLLAALRSSLNLYHTLFPRALVGVGALLFLTLTLLTAEETDL